MVLIKQLYKMLPLLFLTAVNPAYAGDLQDDLHFIGRYGFDWENVGLARAELEIDQDKDTYTIHLAIESAGVVNLFTHHRSDTITHGRRKGDQYFPMDYESHYWTKKKPRHIKLVFDKKGVITEETVEPPEDHNERPIVPHSLKDGTLDPLTLLMAVRAGNLAPRVFDAKHLWDGKADPIADRKPRILNVSPGAGYRMTRKPVAGMTTKETKEYNQGEPVLTFYFTADDARVPFFMKIPIFLGHLEGNLIKKCKTWDECRIK
jgi:Protein of unknown function (DUF3108)